MDRHDYLLALEDERRKVLVFQRELPLCLDLVTQTIERMRRTQMMGCEEETVSDHGPVIEEFIPLKPTLDSLSSSSSSDDDDAQKGDAERGTPENEINKVMPDWLQSVQLWSHQSSPNKELPCKPVALNATKGGGAFHPFDTSSTTAVDKPATSDTNGHEDNDVKEYKGGDDKEKEEEQSQPNNSRKPRRCWAPDLHRRFLQALQQLGGSHAATPKQIRELMKVDGLTNDEVKSHLQKYRLHMTRRPSTTTAQSSITAAATAPQFVVMGSCIWVPQPAEYATGGAFVSMPAATANVSVSANPPVYAPVATLPQKQHKSEVRPSGETGDGSSASPAVSSSSQTTFA